MKFFVLASNSFTGAHFVDYLLTKTDHEVVGVSRSPEYPSVLLPYLYNKPRSNRFKFTQMNVNEQLSQILELIDVEKPEYIVNFAAQGEVRNSWSWPDQWFETNVMAIVRMTTELAKRKFIKKYVMASTPEVYGGTGVNISENHNYQPSTPYAVSKLAGDLHLMTLQKRFDFPVAFTRAANLYGIHQQLYRIIPRTVLYIKKNKRLQLHGGGKAVRSFIHARDVADATYRVCTKGVPGEVYHVAPEGGGISMRELVESICKKMNVKMDQHVDLIEENFGQDPLFSLSAKKIRKDLGWNDEVTFEIGVGEVIQWIEQNWETIRTLPDDYQHKA